MWIYKLLWTGAALLAGCEFVKFLVEQEEEPKPLPEGRVADEDEDEDDDDEVPGAANEVTIRPPSSERRAEREAQEIAEADHLIVFTVGGLIVASLGRLIFPPARLLSVPLLVIALVPSTRRAWRDFKRRRTLTYTELELGQAAAEISLGQLGYNGGNWLLYGAGKRVLLATRRQASEAIRKTAMARVEAWVLRDGAEVLTPIDEIEAGDLVFLRAGDLVPVDGRIRDGLVGVDQRALTGEATLVELTDGDPVLAGTSVLSGAAVVVAERMGRETIVARVEALLEGAVSYERRIVGRLTRITNRSVRPTLALAAFGFLSRGPLGLVGGFWTNSLDIAWLGAPYSMFNTLRAAARVGVLIKDGRSLELIAGVDVVVFDKIGTLTLERLEVVSVTRSAEFGDLDEIEILRLAAAIGQYQRHPLAEAIVRAASRDPRSLPNTAGERTTIGYGVRGRAGGHDVIVGSQRLFAEFDVNLPDDATARARAAAAAGDSTVFVAIDGGYAASIEIAAQLRDDAREVIRYLEGRGLEVMLLSGDDEAPAQAGSAAFGIPRIVGGVLPEDKCEAIAALQAAGRRVCFVGGGSNDALAMHRANVSVALDGASALAVESAQVLLSSGSLGRLQTLFELGDHFASDQQIIMTSALAATTLNAMAFFFAGFGVVPVLGFYSVGLAAGLVTSALPLYRSYPAPRGAGEKPPLAVGDAPAGT